MYDTHYYYMINKDVYYFLRQQNDLTSWLNNLILLYTQQVEIYG